MDKNEQNQVTNPRQDANFLSVLSFKWLFRTYLTGYKRELEVKDLYSPLPEHSSDFLGNKLSKLWIEEQKKYQKSNKNSRPSLLKILARCFGCDFMMFGLCLSILEFFVKIMQPIMLAHLLRYFTNNQQMTEFEAFLWGTGILVGLILECTIMHPALQGLQHIGMKIRVACCSLIYRKILKVSTVAAEGESNVGQMINLLSNDVNRLDYSVLTLHYIWIAPIQTIIISCLLYREIDLAALGGIFILLLFMPFNGYCGKLVSQLTTKFSYKTDERLRLTNEIISGVKVIKMYAWEKPFSYLINKARKKEMKINRTKLMVTEIWGSLEAYVPRICVFVTILSYILLGNNINVDKVYLITAYYNVLRTTLYRNFVMSTRDYAEALVSIKRLQKFLLFEEVLRKPLEENNCVNLETEYNSAVSFENVTAKWCPESETTALHQVNLFIKTGALTAIVGQVGAGKTTLFHAILNEMPFTSGDIKVNGKISYASQEAWIFGSSVKQNILFGQPLDPERYERVLEVCQLRRDLELLPHGDGTLLAERGANLSGGQCARVNLARAVYRDADIYLLDDPLSAVDARVAKRIFEDCVLRFLKGKTVILVTHQLQHLKRVDEVVVLADGAVLQQGTYAELLESGLDLIKKVHLESEAGDSEQTLPEINDLADDAVKLNHCEEKEQSESRTLGKISAKTYMQYFKAAYSWFLVFSVFVISVLCQVVCSGADYFIAYWVNIEEQGNNFTSNLKDDVFRGRSIFVYIYGAFNISMIFVMLAQAYLFFDMSMKISQNLHGWMFNCIIRTTMAFFKANPVGQIMNRFSKDMGIVDTRVSQKILGITQIFIYAPVVVGIVASVNLWLLIPSAAVGLMAYFIGIFYTKTSRSVKRLEGITRSPVFNHLSASVHGLTTIRALNAQSLLTKEFDHHQDLHSSAWFIFFSGSRAFGMYLEFLCSIFTGVVVYTLLSFENVTLAGDAGLVVTQCILLTGMLQWGIQCVAELENDMTSVERILEYSELPEEPALETTADNKAPENWPDKGRIVFKNVSLTYDRQESPALKNLSFTIESNEMIGIVGRTGAGKSSIMSALFRLSSLEGEIYIDDVSTDKISLQQLRSKISVIPQEPVLFAGTLRKNLDPFEEFSDHDLWQALEYVEMKTSIESDLGLNMRIVEAGKNFSAGQKQLLCLARAIVRNNKILILDEATANVDPFTDELIQKAIRKKFENCTVLVIAHRLNTVMDCNRILVMDAGQVVEFDHPYNLFQREDGIFCNMAKQTGDAMFRNLFKIAKSSYETQK